MNVMTEVLISFSFSLTVFLQSLASFQQDVFVSVFVITQ